MGELGVVLIVDASVDGFARVARRLHDGWTPLWAPTPSVIRRWRQFLTQPVAAVMLRLDRLDAQAEERLRGIQAELPAPIIVQMAQPDADTAGRLRALGVAEVLPLLCLPSALESALRSGARNEHTAAAEVGLSA